MMLGCKRMCSTRAAVGAAAAASAAACAAASVNSYLLTTVAAAGLCVQMAALEVSGGSVLVCRLPPLFMAQRLAGISDAAAAYAATQFALFSHAELEPHLDHTVVCDPPAASVDDVWAQVRHDGDLVPFLLVCGSSDDMYVRADTHHTLLFVTREP